MTGSRKILLRLPADLHDAVKARARHARISINSLLEQYIARGIQSAGDELAESHIVKDAKREFGSKLLGVLLFGSRARGDVHDMSDTDILIVVDDSVIIDRGLYRVWDQRVPDGVSLQIAHLPTTAHDAGSLWLECALDAKILSDPFGLVADFIDQAREYITSGKVIRKTTHGQGFWVPL